MDKRPRRLTPEMKAKAALKTAEGLHNAGLLRDIFAQALADDIASVAERNMDGYEIARALETRHVWDCNFEIAGALDNFALFADEALKDAQKAWAEKNNIQPPFPLGERVKARWGNEVVVGTLVEIFEHGAAQYAMEMEGGTAASGRLIVDFENVWALDAEETD